MSFSVAIIKSIDEYQIVVVWCHRVFLPNLVSFRFIIPKALIHMSVHVSVLRMFI